MNTLLSISPSIIITTILLLLLQQNLIICSRTLAIIKVPNNNNNEYFPIIIQSILTNEHLTIEQPLDHFSTTSNNKEQPTNNEIFLQHYYLYKNPIIEPATAHRTIFFYAGNEAPVTHYIKSCGFMFENQKEFSADLVFAEHRFWGESIPKTLDYSKMGPEQAVEDYIKLIRYLKSTMKNSNDDDDDIKVIVFGGSYGGMLAAWLRLKYPDIIDAAVASSAPILAFPHPTTINPMKPQQQKTSTTTTTSKSFYSTGGSSYWNIVSRSGHLEPCAFDIYSLLTSVKNLATPSILQELGACSSSSTKQKQLLTSQDINLWIAFAFDNLAMGDYHFPTDYISSPYTLPAFPLKIACEKFQKVHGGWKGLRQALNVWYNVSGTESCYHIPKMWDIDFYDGLWDRMWCLEVVPQESYFSMEGYPNDAFLPSSKFNWQKINQHCQEAFGIEPQRNGIYHYFGAVTEKQWHEKASRIIFTNGKYDPWMSGGLLRGCVKCELITILIEDGAHHSDLMFSIPGVDSPSLIKAREETIMWLRAWILDENNPSIVLVDVK
jgi:lysosomal Pro-X carboxypeptidase